MLQNTLSPEQIQNWRKALVLILGPYALIMPDELVQKFRDKMQKELDDKYINDVRIEINPDTEGGIEHETQES